MNVLLSFTAASRRLALPLADIRRIAPLPLLTAPVGAPRFVEGFFDFLGAPVAALRLDRLFGLCEEQLGLYTPLLVLKGDNPAIALHVSRTNAIVKIDPSDIQSIGDEETLNGCIVGRFTEGGETTYLLSAAELLLAVERERLAAHCVMRQRRLDALDNDGAHAS